MEQLLQTFGVDWRGITVQVVNFGILAFLLHRFAYKPMLQMLADRTKRIQDSLAAADSMQQQAQAAEEERQKHLIEAQKKAQEIVDSAHEAAEKVRVQEIERTKAELESLHKKSVEQIAIERKEAFDTVRKDVAELVVEATGAVTKGALKPSAKDALVQQALDDSTSK